MSKPRSDSWLRNLPADRQEQVIEWSETPAERDPETGKAIPKTGGYHYAREQLAADGIKVSLGTLSDFYSWYHLQKTFEQADGLTSDIEELLTRKFPDIDPKKISDFGQTLFTLQAANAQNQSAFVEIEKLRLAKEKESREHGKFQLDREKFETDAAEKMLSEAMRAKADEINASSMSNAEKIKAMRKAAFADIDALQASGAVQIPTA